MLGTPRAHIAFSPASVLASHAHVSAPRRLLPPWPPGSEAVLLMALALLKNVKSAILSVAALFLLGIYLTYISSSASPQLSVGPTVALRQPLLYFTSAAVEISTEDWQEHAITTGNRTPNARLMIYNRVPKCGSTTMQTLLRTLARLNNFTHRSSTLYGQRRLVGHEEARYVRSLSRELASQKEPLSVDRHLYFVDFADYNQPRPIYINMVREPIERFVSSFYYARSPERWERLLKQRQQLHHIPHDDTRIYRIPRSVRGRSGREGGSKAYYHRLLVAGRRRELAGSAWASKNFTACVLSGDKECAFIPGSSRETMVSFFCGSEPQCLVVNNEEALQRAKHNLETAYSVVGVVEQLEDSMAVMERYVPRFLGGMRAAFATLREEWRRRNRTPHPAPSAVVRRALERNLTADMELYQFATQRLHQQLRTINAFGTFTTSSPASTSVT